MKHKKPVRSLYGWFYLEMTNAITSQNSNLVERIQTTYRETADRARPRSLKDKDMLLCHMCLQNRSYYNLQQTPCIRSIVYVDYFVPLETALDWLGPFISEFHVKSRSLKWFSPVMLLKLSVLHSGDEYPRKLDFRFGNGCGEHARIQNSTESLKPTE